ncbi:PadR family transcriptional regulator [Thermoproteota archaeon]
MNLPEIRKIDKQLTKGLLDIIVLGMLRSKSMHGYKIITSIRKNFGIYFGPSTIYPFLSNLEEKGLIKSQWDTTHDRPRKVYCLTPDGNSILIGCEQSFNNMCLQLNKIGMSRLPSINANQNNIILDQVGVQ